MIEISGRTVNGGDIEGKAVVLQAPFNFTGDFDPKTGILGPAAKELSGKSIGGMILVIPGAKGAVTAAIALFHAKKTGNAPIGILCRKADPITVECAMVIDIPVMDSFDKEVVDIIKTGDYVRILGAKGIVEVYDWAEKVPDLKANSEYAGNRTSS